ncbi:MAG: Stf0 family sulfotransferase, partial [Planctomycetota bacterium]
ATHYGLGSIEWFYLSRHDRVRQAVSYERALFLDEWLTYGEPKSGASMPYDPAQITNRINNINYQHDWFTAFFNRHKLTPTRLFYEDLVEDIPGTMEMIFDKLGVGQFVPSARHRNKQAHDDVEQHIQRYYNELAEWSGLWSPKGKR